MTFASPTVRANPEGVSSPQPWVSTHGPEIPVPTILHDKILACLYGGAIGDALGAPAEGKAPDQIRDRYGAITDFVEPWDGPSPIGKGDGRYTDDTHMIQLLGRLYVETGDHLDVFRFAQGIVPLIADEPRWVAEYGREMLLVDRLFYPEKWLLMRLRLANADPRLGGVGNMVNCGAAMYAAPVGIVNAADPDAAYREAIEIFGAHQTSYGLEAAGVMAACVAEALAATATIDSVIATALRLANEGTRVAIEAVVDRAASLGDWRDAIVPLRDAIRPYDGAADDFHDRGNRTNDWQPSRLHSIEELPIALGFLVVCRGDFKGSICGGANYGRDCDSIAGMAGSIAGALHGTAAIRPTWIGQIDAANRCDLRPLAADLTSLAMTLQKRQLDAATKRDATFSTLGKPA
jgi:ADP-ribosylglycohydrolase